jgi:hypothetical protein
MTIIPIISCCKIVGVTNQTDEKTHYYNYIEQYHLAIKLIKNKITDKQSYEKAFE